MQRTGVKLLKRSGVGATGLRSNASKLLVAEGWQRSERARLVGDGWTNTTTGRSEQNEGMIKVSMGVG